MASRASGSRATWTWPSSVAATRWWTRPGNTRSAWTSPATATLDVAGGWLDVADRVDVGARGVLALAGGRLAAGELRLDDRAAVEVDASRASRDAAAIAVRGAVRLGGDLRVRASARPRPGTSWTLLTVAGGITGGFRSVPSGYAVTVDHGRVTLTFRGHSDYLAAR